MENTQTKKRSKAGPILIAVTILLVVALVGAVVIVGFLGFQIYDYVTYVPEYSSTATLYILKQNEDDDVDQDHDSVEVVINDCKHLFRSHSVLCTVIEDLDLDMSYDELRKRVSIAIIEKTYIFTVTVCADTPENAKRIVDKVCEVGVDKITEATGFEQVHLYEYGILNTAPCNEGFNIFRFLGF